MSMVDTPDRPSVSALHLLRHMNTLPLQSGVSQAVSALRRGDLLQTFPLWQLRLVVELWDSRMQRGPANRRDTLLTSEFLPVMKNAVDATLDSWLKGEERLHVQTFSLIGSIVLFWGFFGQRHILQLFLRKPPQVLNLYFSLR